MLGYGLSGDASHITAGRQDGEGALLAIRGAFRNFLSYERRNFVDARRNQLYCINAHATSTPLGDAAELTAIQKFVRELKEMNSNDVTLPDDGLVRVTSHKGNFGHLVRRSKLLHSSFVSRFCVCVFQTYKNPFLTSKHLKTPQKSLNLAMWELLSRFLKLALN